MNYQETAHCDRPAKTRLGGATFTKQSETSDDASSWRFSIFTARKYISPFSFFFFVMGQNQHANSSDKIWRISGKYDGASRNCHIDLSATSCRKIPWILDRINYTEKITQHSCHRKDRQENELHSTYAPLNRDPVRSPSSRDRRAIKDKLHVNSADLERERERKEEQERRARRMK